MKAYCAGPLLTLYERDFVSECGKALQAHGIDAFVPQSPIVELPNDTRSSPCALGGAAAGFLPTFFKRVSGTPNFSWFTSIPRSLIDIIVLLIFILSAVPAMRSFFTGSDPAESEHLGGRFVTRWR